MKKKPFIAVVGNIGVGKTTFTKLLAEKMDLIPYYESVDNNPYLSDFYNDMDRWGFNLQVYFLQHRFSHHMEINNLNKGVIQDRTIYEDAYIFAYNLHEMKIMSKRDWNTYINLFNNMTQFLQKPDLVIYLKASTDTLIDRIKNRNRDYEKDIDKVYLHTLNVYYNKWLSRTDEFNILKIDTNNFNIFKDKKKLDKIYSDIDNKLNKL